MASEHRRWLEKMDLTSVGGFNAFCVSGRVAELVRVAEGFHERRIARLADSIAAQETTRIIAIAGPSSSGKTTLIKRLTVQLQTVGIQPVSLSLDDYYVDRERTPRDERGEWDFESVEAIDRELLRDHVARLLRGERVKVARYDFPTGRSFRDGGRELALEPHNILMIEGIHGLNPELFAAAMEDRGVFRIFIHPSLALPFDRLTSVDPADLRLLRRIVRDRHQRGIRAEDNLLRWGSVRRGESRNIWPFLPYADAVFDSSLAYEPSVLKVFAERYLLEVPKKHHAYAEAYRLRHLIDRFVAIYPDHVPPTSILREFIGGSGFEY